MRVMLFGAAGQLGNSLHKALAAKGIPCAALTRKDCNFATTSKDELKALVKGCIPTIIINAAAWAAVDDAEKHRDETHKMNAQVPGWLAAIAAKQDITLVHFSTDYVFDGVKGVPYSETSKTNPANHYGKTKLDGEQLILKSEAKAYIFRLQLLYQATGNSFFCRMLALMNEKSSLKVVADQLSAPTTVADVTTAIMGAFPRMEKDTLLAGIYHMAAGGHTSRHGFACAIREEMLARDIACKTKEIVPVVSEEFPSPALRPKDTRLDTEKLAKAGIALPHWRESLKTVMDGIDEGR